MRETRVIKHFGGASKPTPQRRGLSQIEGENRATRMKERGWGGEGTGM